jgi:hypothetical protein
MNTSNFWTFFVIAIIVLHFVVDFGYLIYKLSPMKGDKKEGE